MVNDKGILIRNIFYMLSYAFQVLRQTNYEQISAEEFDHAEDLLAAILEKGISQQIKQGLYREYTGKQEDLPVIRGKIYLSGTIHNIVNRKQLVSCEYDELSENNLLNQILKTAAMVLFRSSHVSKIRKHSLKQILLFFSTVDSIDPGSIPWNRIQLNRNNQTYEMLLNISRLVLDSLLPDEEKGEYRLPKFIEDNMPGLYERFVREYYRQHYGRRLSVSAEQVEWDLTEGSDMAAIKYLPKMQTDITLRDRISGKTLIIDTKYYTHTMQHHYDSTTFHSNNIYQIFSYVKNEAAKATGKVSGMLLYAKTGEDITPDSSFILGGNAFSVKTLDLNQEFRDIAGQLDRIAEEIDPGIGSAKFTY